MLMNIGASQNNTLNKHLAKNPFNPVSKMAHNANQRKPNKIKKMNHTEKNSVSRLFNPNESTRGRTEITPQ